MASVGTGAPKTVERTDSLEENVGGGMDVERGLQGGKGYRRNMMLLTLRRQSRRRRFDAWHAGDWRRQGRMPVSRGRQIWFAF